MYISRRVTEWLARLLVLSTGSFLLVAVAAVPGQAAETQCREKTLDVALVPGGPADQQIVGTLCANGDPNQILHVTVSGATYSSIYWDFPYQPERYSYTKAMNRAGIATFNFDRVGIGRSSHPPSVLISVPTQIFVLHQVVQALRNGELGQFQKIVLVGHSLGTAISIGAAVLYPNDVNGVIATGAAHAIDPVGTAVVFSGFVHVAKTEGGRFADLPDVGYLTTPPGKRAEMFYHLSSADPAVIARDEATKETVTATEVATVFGLGAYNSLLQVPVLVVLGEHDKLFCTLVPCSSPLSMWHAERLSYPLVSSFDSLLVPKAGHDVNLHPTTDRFFAKASAWSQAVL